MFNEREISEHDLFYDVCELRMDKIRAEERNAGTYEGNELGSHVRDGVDESFQNVRDEELIGKGLDEFESNFFDTVFLYVR
jgi:hypothetical protein